MIFDNENQKKDFEEILQKYPAPNAAAGYQMIHTYLPLIREARVVPVEDQVLTSDVEESEANE